MEFICSECGKPIAEDAAFCPHCGASFDEEIVEAPKSKNKKDAPSAYDREVAKTSAKLIQVGNYFSTMWYVLAGLIGLAGIIIAARAGDDEAGITALFSCAAYAVACVFVGMACKYVFKWMSLTLQGITLIKNKK